MKKRVIYEYTEEDIKILRNPCIPKNPCEKCHNGFACLGCEDGRKYLKVIDEYRSAGILEEASIVSKILEKQQQIQLMEHDIASLKASLLAEIRGCIIPEGEEKEEAKGEAKQNSKVDTEYHSAAELSGASFFGMSSQDTQKEPQQRDRDFTIIAADFDGTLCKAMWPDIGEPNIELMEYLKEQREQGAKLILWTCRAGEPLVEAVQFCREHGLYFDAVNQNLPEMRKRHNNDSRKIYADIYIDDKSSRWTNLPFMGVFERGSIMKDLQNEIDMLHGNIVRMRLSDDVAEIAKMYYHANRRLSEIFKTNLERVCTEKDSQ